MNQPTVKDFRLIEAINKASERAVESNTNRKDSNQKTSKK